MLSLDEIDYLQPEFAQHFDELPLWSAAFGRMILEQVPLRSTATYVDAGSGTGFLSIELAQRCGANAKIIAVDSWKAAIIKLQDKVNYLRLENVKALDCSIEDAPIANDSVDVVVSNLGVNNFDNPIAALHACHRMCCPGGRILLSTNVVGHMAEFYRVFERVLEQSGQTDRLPLLRQHIEHRSTVESLMNQLEQVGFSVKHVRTGSFQERYANGSAFLRHFFIRLGFMPGWKAVVGAENAHAMFHLLEQALNDHAGASGELSLTIPMALAEAQKMH